MKKILEVKNIFKSYPAKPTPFKALNDISLNGYEGEVLGILGPNGSGKTTIIKSIASLLEYDKGQVLINGIDNLKDRKKILPYLGAVLDGNRNIYWRLTTLENIHYFSGLRGLDKNKTKKKVDEILKALMLEEIKDKEVRLLSRGMKQKVAIACSLIHNPALLLLDEPTLGLDIEISRGMEKWIKKYAKEEKKCIIVTSHDMDFIEEVCDRVIIIQKGKIIFEGNVKDIKDKYYNQKRVRITLNNRISESALNSLKEICDLKFETVDNKSTFSFKMKNIKSFHSLMGSINSHDLDLYNIHTMEDDFEDIFMDIIKH
ncbi:MAG: ABC transporter ATP-binding protein [Epsilonproteobacteria bacterium]|nr:MAG: ABC transporter ATP-binding protein [Campylobacterota bacterium]RLA62612.1 MAG: ABC transporter ATP-binding protein [Campylobacterota bacterium]